MRVESSVLSLSWIPSEAVPGMLRLPFERGLLHFDEPPPDTVEDVEALRAADRFRFANHLRAWIEVREGRVVGHGQTGGGLMGVTHVRWRSRDIAFTAVAFPDLRPEPEVRPDGVRFTQTTGGRAALPSPRPVPRKPFVQLFAPTVWTTLALTLYADGRAEGELLGASPFPRHWVYDAAGALIAKSGLMDLRAWTREAFGTQTPWGGQDTPALVAAAESALERELSVTIMRGGTSPEFRSVPVGATVTEQGEPGDELFLLLDGVLAVEVDGETVAEVGPGAILGERALLEGGRRTSTLRAATPCRLAVVPPDRVDRDALAELSGGHRREGDTG